VTGGPFYHAGNGYADTNHLAGPAP